MKATLTRFTLLCSLGLLALPVQAIFACTKAAAPAATSSGPTKLNLEVPQVARLLAGVAPRDEPADPVFSQYAAAVNDGWQAYTQNFGQPLSTWVTREIRQEAGQTVFYPFSGPDLPSILAVYPGASRFVLISDQYAIKYFDPFALDEAEKSRIVRELGEAWINFGQRGFFVTQELNKGGERKYHPSPSMILMAFAVRLGYEVRAIRPTCLDPADLSIHPSAAKDARWGSVRLELRKDGRDIVVDYLQQDLSNRGLGKPQARALVESLAKNSALLKAASHLLQQPGFSILRNALLSLSPLVVQDETGLEYDAMAKHFNVKLYGEYIGAHRSFKEATNPSLVAAYKDRVKDVRPLDFKLGYEKEAGSAIQVATRK